MFIAYLIAANITAAFVTLFYALMSDGFWSGVLVYIITANIVTVVLPFLLCAECYKGLLNVVRIRRGKWVRARAQD